ncbi:MAG: amidohydrolase [Candidatus Rokubacteria bacterium]|nr:amidohydrolase [Candidatus Rokubacteria bacterium]
MHVHPGTQEYVIDAGAELHRHAFEYLGRKLEVETGAEMAALYRRLDIMGVVFAWDAETATGLPRVSNDYVAGLVREFPDVFIGFASVDPWKGKWALKEVERAIVELGLRGVKFQPIAQAFYPNDRRFYPLWAECARLGVPVVFHVGITGLGAGVRGGDGLHLKYAQPLHLDDVAADFPELTIIGAHPAWPWQDEMLAIALHKTNVYFDLSGWSPKYFPPSLLRYTNSLLQDRALFGSDYPFFSPERWLRDFETIDLKPEVREKVLFTNARKLLRLDEASR